MKRTCPRSQGPVPDLPGEVWRDWGEHWAVSNLGRFKAKERIVEHSGGLSRRHERLLRPTTVGGPHRRTVTYRYQADEERRAASIYRMMWEAFRGPLPPGAHLMCDGEISLANLTTKAGHTRSYS